MRTERKILTSIMVCYLLMNHRDTCRFLLMQNKLASFTVLLCTWLSSDHSKHKQMIAHPQVPARSAASIPHKDLCLLETRTNMCGILEVTHTRCCPSLSRNP